MKKLSKILVLSMLTINTGIVYGAETGANTSLLKFTAFTSQQYKDLQAKFAGATNVTIVDLSCKVATHTPHGGITAVGGGKLVKDSTLSSSATRTALQKFKQQANTSRIDGQVIKIIGGQTNGFKRPNSPASQLAFAIEASRLTSDHSK